MILYWNREPSTAFGFANHVELIFCFIYYKKWVQSAKCMFKIALPQSCEQNVLEDAILRLTYLNN